MEEEVMDDTIVDSETTADSSSAETESSDVEGHDTNADELEKLEIENKSLKEALQRERERKMSRVEKKEVKKEAKEVVKEVGLSPKDYLALTENKVSSEEFDDVVEISKLLKKPIFETLKDKTARLILQAKREERATAEATATSGSGSRKSGSPSSKILGDYERGIKPDTEETAAALATAQFEQLLNKKGTK